MRDFQILPSARRDGRVQFAACPKCGEDEPDAIYMANGAGRAAGDWPRSCSHGDQEHFDLRCRRCFYRYTADLDASGSAP